jgi:ribonucleoside-triphosphate reductase
MNNTNEAKVTTSYVSDILPEEFLNKYINKQVPWGFNGLGYIVYKRTYARKLENSNQTEEWWQTVARCINGSQKLGADYTTEEAQRLFDLVFNLKCNFAGRMLWQLGTSTVDRFGANSLLNCWFVAINDPKAFLFIFENLMLGGGVGFSIRREDIHELPKVKKNVSVNHLNTKDADFIVPDSRQGWVELLRKILEAFYVNGKSFSYSTILVRGAGERISGFGGLASGPGPLIDGVQRIIKIFSSREGKKLRSIDVLDICNIIGSVVVAGNVRRSAQIALGDPDDYLYLRAKNWSLGTIPNWRAMSNNTIYADEFDHISNEIWENGYVTDSKTGFAKGEPYGFFNLPLSQKCGRTKDGPMKSSKLYPTDEDNVQGTNPCGEISLSSYECCNLAELYLNNIESKEELFDCAKLLYKSQKAIASLPFIHEETNKIVHKNMRLGLGVTGICQSIDKLPWLDECYVQLRKFDKEWSKQKGYPQSIKLTTTKPSGTLSLLAGSTPGVHPAYSQYYIRRVRMASSDALVSVCRELGYQVEYALNFDGTENHDTVVVSFPCSAGTQSILAKDMSAIQQLELVKQIQSVWSDNAVSVTVYYRKEELTEIKEWLKNNFEENIKSVSFLLHNEHGFVQAPYEEISEENYNKMSSKVKLITTLYNTGYGDLETLECAGGVCPVK